MQGFKDLLNSERGVTWLLLLVITVAFVVLGMMTMSDCQTGVVRDGW